MLGRSEVPLRIPIGQKWFSQTTLPLSLHVSAAAATAAAVYAEYIITITYGYARWGFFLFYFCGGVPCPSLAFFFTVVVFIFVESRACLYVWRPHESR